jgi:calcium-dependent protein kinase
VKREGCLTARKKFRILESDSVLLTNICPYVYSHRSVWFCVGHMSVESEAHARIRDTCLQAFNRVDVESAKFIDLSQTKNALMFVFQQLKGELPQPYDYWFELVFRNFDRDRDGLIHFNDFCDIVIQYYDHYQAKLMKQNRVETSSEPDAYASMPTRTPASGSFVANSHINPAFPAAMQHYANSVSKTKPNTTEATKSAQTQSPKKQTEFNEINGKLAIFDDYEFFDKAGQGSFGKVMVVRHKATKQVRACKAITLRGGQNQLELIKTETHLLRSLDHPNILKLFETYYDGSNVYMISELCEGGSLMDRLNFHYPPNQKNNPNRLMSEGLVALIMQQLLAAVACCHSQKIIHRDIKPDNILFVNRSKESPLKLIDFGLATTLENALKTVRELKIKRKGLGGILGKIVPSCLPGCVPQYTKRRVMTRAGTIHYFSPEMIRGEYTELTDVFSVGIIMYQLLTGIHPFYTPGVDDENSVRFKISKRDAEFPVSYWSHISTDAKDLTRRLLVRDPNHRITAAQAIKHRWFKDPLKPTLHGSNGGSVTQSIFEGLREYSKSTRLKQALLRLLARELTEIQTQDLRKKFLSLDKSGDGRITRDELVSGLKAVGINPNEVETIMPPTGENSISYNIFLAALSERKVKYGKNQLREAFKKLEPNGDNIIQMDALVNIIVTNITAGNSDATLIEQILKEAALNVTDIGISFDGFCDIVSFGYVTGVVEDVSN